MGTGRPEKASATDTSVYITDGTGLTGKGRGKKFSRSVN